MNSLTKLGFAILAALLFIPANSSANAAPQREHPAYLHALSDLRDARAHLDRHDGGELREQEKKAIHEINDAIDEIKKAAIDDGKDINEHAPVDARMDWSGRLHRAVELLDRAHNDVAREEDNPSAHGLQQRALEHIDKAHRHVEEAIAAIR
jgi:hypothetical protein